MTYLPRVVLGRYEDHRTTLVTTRRFQDEGSSDCHHPHHACSLRSWFRDRSGWAAKASELVTRFSYDVGSPFVAGSPVCCRVWRQRRGSIASCRVVRSRPEQISSAKTLRVPLSVGPLRFCGTWRHGRDSEHQPSPRANVYASGKALRPNDLPIRL